MIGKDFKDVEIEHGCLGWDLI